jgi:LAO/AO transport system kinase
MGLAENIIKGDAKSAARLISLIEDGNQDGYYQLSLLLPHIGSAHVIGVTGPAGAGKSTLTGSLAAAFSQQGKKVGVVATDPTSMQGGGALLGDRIRMKEAEGSDVFIRSMADRGHPGGMARAVIGAVYVLEALGKDTIFVETMGAGQSEKELFHLCDTIIVLFTREYGDEIQLLKAGLMEIGDIVVVNKGDLPGATDAQQELSTYASKRIDTEGWVTPVLVTHADRGVGVAEVMEAIQRHWQFITEEGRRERRRKEKIAALTKSLLKEEAWERLCGAIADDEECTRIAEDAGNMKIDPYSAVERIMEKVAFGIKGG